MSDILRRFTRRLVRASRAGLFVLPGHFYSPIVQRAHARRHLEQLPADFRDKVGEIRIDRSGHLAFWAEIRPLLEEIPFRNEPVAGLRYYFDNDAFGVGDGSMLYAMLRHFRPRRLIEVGSGYSSACSLDTIERFLGNSVETTFIEPHPALLERLLTPSDRGRVRVIPTPVQDVEPAFFDVLESGDLLFIDSTHVLKTGSDVAFELFEVLPRLKAGVVVHFHDIFAGFEYPRAWVVDDNRSWNELYALRAFLMYNDAFEIIFFNSFFAHSCADEIRASYPRFLENPGGSLWLRKTR
ncbi:MAG: class I SAM-dependent methyltransferase [Burkholderiaceae bacterium]